MFCYRFWRFVSSMLQSVLCHRSFYVLLMVCEPASNGLNTVKIGFSL